jgi:hypothetical protein
MAATRAAVLGAEHMYQQQALTAAYQPHILAADGATFRWRGIGLSKAVEHASALLLGVAC